MNVIEGEFVSHDYKCVRPNHLWKDYLAETIPFEC